MDSGQLMEIGWHPGEAETREPFVFSFFLSVLCPHLHYVSAVVCGWWPQYEFWLLNVFVWGSDFYFGRRSDVRRELGPRAWARAAVIFVPGLWLFLNFEVFRSFLCDLIAPWNFGSVWHMRLRVGVLQLWRCWRSGFISRRLHAAAAEEAEEGTRRQPGMWMGLMGQDWWIGRRGWKMVLSVFWDLNFRVRPKEERCILFKTEFYVARYLM